MELNNTDRIVTRIYWLLNDRYVTGSVETLRGGGQEEI
jgi:hypothetical protein